MQFRKFAIGLMLAATVLVGCQWVISLDSERRALPQPVVPVADAAPLVDTGPPCPPEAQWQTDPNHCGTCNHSCRGEGCAAGLCERKLVAKLTGYGSCVLRYGNRVIVEDRPAIISYSVDGRDPKPLLANFAGGCARLAVHNDTVLIGLDGPARLVRNNFEGKQTTTLWTGPPGSRLYHHHHTVRGGSGRRFVRTRHHR
jgi:hypothetical protein